jgi:hypothetical protein
MESKRLTYLLEIWTDINGNKLCNPLIVPRVEIKHVRDNFCDSIQAVILNDDNGVGFRLKTMLGKGNTPFFINHPTVIFEGTYIRIMGHHQGHSIEWHLKFTE